MNGQNNENSNIELALLVPPKLTKAAYAILLENECVGRRWHLEGRYGSRTHPVDEENINDHHDIQNTNRRKMAIPLLHIAATKMISFIMKKKGLRKGDADISATFFGKENLQSLLMTDEVEILYQKKHIPKNKPRQEGFDATINSHRRVVEELILLSSTLFPLKKNDNYKNNNDNKRSRKKSIHPAFTYAELFAGIGGFGVALERLGGKCVFACEIDKSCHRLYRDNICLSSSPSRTTTSNDCSSDNEKDTDASNTIPIHEDIWDISTNEIPGNIDLLVGGFPCQPFSSLGEQLGFRDTKDDNRRGLLFTQIVRILKNCQPRAFLLENVPGLLTTKLDNGSKDDDDDNYVIDTILSSLESVGYDVTMEICNARCLVAQSRKRLFFVGLLRKLDTGKGQQEGKKHFEFPFIPDLGIRAGDVIECDINPKEQEEYDNGNGDDIVNSPPDRDSSTYNVSKVNLISNSCLDLYHLSDTQMDQLLHRSKKWKPAHMAWSDTVCDTMDSHYGVTIGKGNSQLVPCSAPLNPRTFTPRECARVMGFPNSYRLPHQPAEGQGDMAFVKALYHMFGNAVCPPLVAAISGAILAQCPSIAGYANHSNWTLFGIETAVLISLECIIPNKRKIIENRLIQEWEAAGL